jgi:hypothetical protein
MIIRVFNIDWTDAIYMLKKINKTSISTLQNEVIFDNKDFTRYTDEEARTEHFAEDVFMEIDDFLLQTTGLPVVSGFEWEEHNEKE